MDIAALDITTSSAGLTGFAGACALALGRLVVKSAKSNSSDGGWGG